MFALRYDASAAQGQPLQTHELHLKYSHLRYICFADVLHSSEMQMLHGRLKLLPNFCRHHAAGVVRWLGAPRPRRWPCGLTAPRLGAGPLPLAAAYGLPVPKAEIASFGQQRVLVVERFDQMVSNDGRSLLRLVQEDFCQATGTSPLVKYEAEGGPGLGVLFNLLQQSVDAERDLRTLMTSQLLFWMLRAPGGHAKNFSIHLLPGGRYRLTPLYDVMSAYPVMGDGPNHWSLRALKLAMALVEKSRHYEAERIQRRHFNSTAKRFGYGETAEPLIQELIECTPAVIDEVQRALPAGFSQQVADKVLGGLQSATRALEGMPAA